MKNKHERYLAQAEESFSNAGGHDEYSSVEGDDALDSQFFASEGYDDAYGTGVDEFHPAQGNPSARKIPDFDRTYTVTIENTLGAAQNVSIFGANRFLLAANFGNPAGVNIEVGESSYVEMLQESQESPFVISGFRLTSSNNAQLDQVMKIQKRTGNGQDCSYPLQIANYFSAFQFQAGIREVYPYHIEFAGTTSLEVSILANTTMVMTLFVAKRIEPSNVLTGTPAREYNRTALPFQYSQKVVVANQ